MAWYDWKPYVPVGVRRQRAERKMQALRKKGIDIQPVEIQGRKIARTFWGQAWCDHLESFSDYANRLPRGRTYVRNGSVCHLAISKGNIEAKVTGTEIYNLRIGIKTLAGKKWQSVKKRSAGAIGSLIELLQGKLSDHVMEVVTDRKEGLFPLPGEISFDCDCPDWATMCKHVAAVLYGVGARLDERPELLFVLRGVDHEELITSDAEAAVAAATTRGKSKRLASTDLADVFGIDIQAGDDLVDLPTSRTRKKKRSTQRPSTGKKKPAKRNAKVGPKGSATKGAKGKKKASGKTTGVKKKNKGTTRKKKTKKVVKTAAAKAPRKKTVRKKKPSLS
ncbi:MAG: hypothetical protein ACC628_00075 [Pirellulaceae bacterium]